MTSQFAVRNLSGGYGDTVVVKEVSLQVGRGEVLGVLGRNGAGKTTLARLVTGALPISAGEVLLNGRALQREPAHRRRALGLGYLPQTQVVFDTLNVRDNLSLTRTRCPPEAYYDRFPRLAQRQTQLAGTLSGGERKILGFVRAMIEDTDVVVLDEPSEGVQPENIELMAQCIRERADAGVSVILCEQNLGLIKRVADCCLCLETGCVVLDSAADLLSESDLRALIAL